MSDFFYSLSSSKYYFIQFYFSKNEGGRGRKSRTFLAHPDLFLWSILEVLALPAKDDDDEEP